MNSEGNGMESASFFGELGGFMKPYAGRYAASVVISVLGVAAKLVSYALVGWIAGMVFSQDAAWSRVFSLAVAAALCKLLNAVLLNAATWISHKAAYLTLKDIRSAVTAKMMRLPMGYFEENGSGRLKTLIVDHIEGMEKTLAHMLPEMTANLLTPLAMSVCMFFIDWRLALCAAVWIILGFGVTSGMMKGYAEKYAGQIAALKNMNQVMVEYVGGIEVIKNFGRADACYQKYQEAVYGHAAYNVGWQKETLVWSSLGLAIAPFSLFPVLIVGLLLYGNQAITGGALFLAILLALGVFGPLMNAMGYFDQLAAMGTNAREIKKVLDYPELKRGMEEIGFKEKMADHLDIAFRDVSFSYTMEGHYSVEEGNFME
ncbi:MAG: ABC transporter ATP-binding protein/permease, partial [Lachnospiraceae bacterium]|nr:ABC transporter ATP-binding protein/permease [Lachnospiraceae bacterium]